MVAVQTYLEEVRDLACAPLLRLVTEQVQGLDPELESEAGAFGLRFRLGERTLCELSVFGELFIARVGHAVEYRVRQHDVALAALDHVLHDYLELRAALPSASAPPPR